MPNCTHCGQPTSVALATSHILAADIVMRRTLDFLDAVLPVLIEADPEEKLMQFVTPLQDALDTYTEIRLGCAVRVPDESEANPPEKAVRAPCICHPLGDCPPAPITERSTSG